MLHARSADRVRAAAGHPGQGAIEVATICSAADLALIAAGAVGLGALLESFPSFARSAGWVSAAFVFGYGLKLLADLSLTGPPSTRVDRAHGRSRVAMTAVALSVLNPQVYLEMVGVVGSVALRFAEVERAVFALGVMLVSPLWFFGLAIGGRRMAARMGSQRVARAFDMATAAIMLGLGAALAMAELGLRS